MCVELDTTPGISTPSAAPSTLGSGLTCIFSYFALFSFFVISIALKTLWMARNRSVIVKIIWMMSEGNVTNMRAPIYAPAKFVGIMIQTKS